MSIDHIKLYDLCRKELHLPDDKAADMVYSIGKVAVAESAFEKNSLATKDDMSALKNDIHSLSLATKDDMSALKNDIHSLSLATKDDFHSLEIKLERYRADSLKAMIWISTVQLLAILSGIFAISKFLK